MESISGPKDATPACSDEAIATGAYYHHSRPELRTLIPADCDRVLDVGCGAGQLGRCLKAERPVVYVIGVERRADMAMEAGAVLDQIVCGDAESVKLDLEPGSIDCIVFADVLEHMVEPERTLKRYVELLSRRGCVVASIPNVAHLSVIFNLIGHRWRYGERGLLDRTHLRFFTKRSVLDLFRRCGLEQIALSREYRLTNNPRATSHARLARFLGTTLLGDYLAYRFLVVARA